MTIPPDLIARYIDGEANDAECRNVEAAAASDPVVAADILAERQLRKMLSSHFDPTMEEVVPERFRLLLEGEPSATVISIAEARLQRARRQFLPSWGNFGAIAATLVAGIALGHFALPAGNSVAGDENLIARGSLAATLDTQLASSQNASANVKIGVSFYDQADRLCRTFAGNAQAGIACKSGNEWELVQTISGKPSSPSTDYRQAGAANPFVMTMAQSMMKGPALDADAERAALRVK